MLDFGYAALAVAKVGVCLLALVIVALAGLVVLVRNTWRLKSQYRRHRQCGYSKRVALGLAWDYFNWSI